jgi:hypothetical protein
VPVTDVKPITHSDRMMTPVISGLGPLSPVKCASSWIDRKGRPCYRME